MVPRSAPIWSSQPKKKPIYETRSAQNGAYSPTGRLHKPLETEIRHDKINPDPDAKRTAGRVAATPAQGFVSDALGVGQETVSLSRDTPDSTQINEVNYY